MRIHPSPVIELNHAVAVSMVDGPERALRLIDSIGQRGEIAGYHMLPAVRGDLLRRLDRRTEAIAAYRQALAGIDLEPERRFLEGRLAELGCGQDGTGSMQMRPGELDRPFHRGLDRPAANDHAGKADRSPDRKLRT